MAPIPQLFPNMTIDSSRSVTLRLSFLRTSSFVRPNMRSILWTTSFLLLRYSIILSFRRFSEKTMSCSSAFFSPDFEILPFLWVHSREKRRPNLSDDFSTSILTGASNIQRICCSRLLHVEHFFIPGIPLINRTLSFL